MFFCLSEGRERDWTEQHLPDDFHDVLALIGHALHDTVRTPKIAENFDCLPEQLLDRVRRLTCPQPGECNGDISPTTRSILDWRPSASNSAGTAGKLSAGGHQASWNTREPTASDWLR